MRQILADAISKFQKITRQMLCDKCSKNDVVIWRENPQNADVTSAAIWGAISTPRAFFSCLQTLLAGSRALSRIFAAALRMISFESSFKLSIPASSMLATISLYGISDGAGANFGPFCRTSTSVLVRDLDKMFTTHFDLSTLFELRYSIARLLSFLECLSLMFLWTERACVFWN